MAMPQPTGCARSVAPFGSSLVGPAAESRETNSPRHTHPRHRERDGERRRRHHTSKRDRQDRGSDERQPHDRNRPRLQIRACTGPRQQRMHHRREQQALHGERPEGVAPQAGGGETTADERPAQRRGRPHHRQAGDDARHQPVRKKAVLGDVDQRDEGAAAQPLHRTPGEQHRHRRSGGADRAAEGVDEGRSHHGPAQTVARHTHADRGRGHDRAHQVQGEGPTDQPQTADVADHLRHDGGRQHRVGGVQPDRQAQGEELRQIRPSQNFAPADVLARRGFDRTFGWTPASVVLHDWDVRRRARYARSRANLVD